MSHTKVTGVIIEKEFWPDPIPLRRNITDLIQDEDQKQWSLYIQALTLLQQEAPEEPLSWFSISAIHGYPKDLKWERAGLEPKGAVYCAHKNPCFHRPYVALYEQALQAAALKVAKKYSEDKDAWIQAAKSFRAPYWDWADPKTYLPPDQVYDSVNFQKLKITTPSGWTSVPNPLLSYRFQKKIDWPKPDPESNEVGFSLYEQTVRHPMTGTTADLDSVKEFKTYVGTTAEQTDWKSQCWSTLMHTNAWLQFSNRSLVRGQMANSLEAIHDEMHIRIGGAGHMGDTISAAFDPIFMLHHVNVDRQFALWQALHYELWISQKNAPDDFEKDLLPFWKNGTEFHRSIDTPVREFFKFGATYPEFVGLENVSDEQRRAAIDIKVNHLYSPRRSSPLMAAAPQTALDRYDWLIRIRANMFQFNQSYTILFFLDSVPDDVSQWRSSHSLVGTYGEFVNSNAESCPNCRTNANLISEGFIRLNHGIERFGYGNQSEGEIEEGIRKKLDWRIQKIDGTVVESKDLKSLEVAVLTWDVTAGDNARPVHRDVLSHKSGGRALKV